MVTLADIPLECLKRILAFSSLEDVLSLSRCCRELHNVTCADDFWAELATNKWGSAVCQLKPLYDSAVSAHDRSWRIYCLKRLSARSIKPSPLSLVQERYPDPWQHLICCVLCARTGKGQQICATIEAFFHAFPTPSAVLGAEAAAITQLIHPLGLQATRLAAVKSISHGFLALDWEDPHIFTGCGTFVVDSWRVFCRGYRHTAGVTDASLKAYLSWLAREEQQDSKEATRRTTARAAKRKQQQQPASRTLRSKGHAVQERQQMSQAEGPAKRTRSVSRQCQDAGR